MTQEVKELLLKDLCARLPYGVKCNVKYIINNETTYGEDVESECIDIIKRISFDTYSVYTEWLGYESDIEDIKPYLRPISSMTEKEVDNLFRILKINEKNTNEWIKVNDIGIIRLFTEEGKDFYEIAEAMDYLHSIHIDYRGLIPKGLALKAPEGMYKDKNV